MKEYRKTLTRIKKSDGKYNFKVRGFKVEHVENHYSRENIKHIFSQPDSKGTDHSFQIVILLINILYKLTRHTS